MTAIMEPPLVLHRVFSTEHPPLQRVVDMLSRTSLTRETVAWQNVSRSSGVWRTEMSPSNSIWISGNAPLMVGNVVGTGVGSEVVGNVVGTGVGNDVGADAGSEVVGNAVGTGVGSEVVGTEVVAAGVLRQHDAGHR